MQASKWLDLPLLVDILEMDQILQILKGCSCFYLGKALQRGKETLEFDEYLAHYQTALACFSQMPSVAFTLDPNDCQITDVGADKTIVAPVRPVLQFQPLRVRYSRDEKTFRTQSFGLDAFFWGVQISYPQLFLDKGNQVHETLKEKEFQNSSLFIELRRWVRQNTLPTPFIVSGELIRSQVRIGKELLKRPFNHPELQKLNIEIGKYES